MSTVTAPAVQDVSEEEVASKGKGKLLLIALVVLVVAGAGAWFFLGGDDEAEAEEAAAPVEGQILALESLVTTTGSAQLHHARVAPALVLREGADLQVVEARVALLEDRLLREVSAMDADQLRSTAGSDQLREALTAGAQEIWPDGEVLRVVLTELLVQ